MLRTTQAGGRVRAFSVGGGRGQLASTKSDLPWDCLSRARDRGNRPAHPASTTPSQPLSGIPPSAPPTSQEGPPELSQASAVGSLGPRLAALDIASAHPASVDSVMGDGDGDRVMDTDVEASFPVASPAQTHISTPSGHGGGPVHFSMDTPQARPDSPPSGARGAWANGPGASASPAQPLAPGPRAAPPGDAPLPGNRARLGHPQRPAPSGGPASSAAPAVPSPVVTRPPKRIHRTCPVTPPVCSWNSLRLSPVSPSRPPCPRNCCSPPTAPYAAAPAPGQPWIPPLPNHGRGPSSPSTMSPLANGPVPSRRGRSPPAMGTPPGPLAEATGSLSPPRVDPLASVTAEPPVSPGAPADHEPVDEPVADADAAPPSQDAEAAPKGGLTAPPKDASGRWKCPVAGCPENCGRAAGWRDLAAYKTHLNRHGSGHLKGSVPASILADLDCEFCPVCSALASRRNGGIHPSCKAKAEALRLAREADPGRGPRAMPPGYPSLMEAAAAMIPVRKHVTAASENKWAEAVTKAHNQVSVHNDLRAWTEHFMLPKAVLLAPKERGGKKHKGHLAKCSMVPKLDRWLDADKAALWEEASRQEMGRARHHDGHSRGLREGHGPQRGTGDRTSAQWAVQ